ncbi:hypothetical protein ONE63_011245 [Megalurothrips usitatus]|uniref:Uncharacterized protein n=1 Tax=Megalurothrips usitatus TaxID=439358 RepID=A0AAV7X3T2_9NEOP|nr:hypothetical protein ONE63_011245 [Megalurothrips usitatus]
MVYFEQLINTEPEINPPAEWLNLMAGNNNIKWVEKYVFTPQHCRFQESLDQAGYTINERCGAWTTVGEFQKKCCAQNFTSLNGNSEGYPAQEAECGMDLLIKLFPDELKEWNLDRLGDCSTARPAVSIGSCGSPISLQKKPDNSYYVRYLHEGEPTEWTVFHSDEKQMIKCLHQKIAAAKKCQFDELLSVFLNLSSPAVAKLKMSTVRLDQALTLTLTSDSDTATKSRSFISTFHFLKGVPNSPTMGDDGRPEDGGHASEMKDGDVNVKVSFAHQFKFLNRNASVKEVTSESTSASSDISKPTEEPRRSPRVTRSNAATQRIVTSETSDGPSDSDTDCSTTEDESNSDSTRTYKFNIIKPRRKYQPNYGGIKLLETIEICPRGKAAVMKVISTLAKGDPRPFGPELLLNASDVIKAIESMNVSGKTMLYYFQYTVRFLKEMTKTDPIKAGRVMRAVKKYQHINYQHFYHSKDAKVPSVERNVLINEHRKSFEKDLLELKASMSLMGKPITVLRGSELAKHWTRVMGFLTLWLQDEIGFKVANTMFNQAALFRAKQEPGGHFYRTICVKPNGEGVQKVMTAALYKALMHYNDIRNWRLPRNRIFFVTTTGTHFKPKNNKKYTPKKYI